MRLFSLRSDIRGNAMIEFALGFPILLLTTLIVFDIGRSLLAYTTVNNLAAEGVRYAAVRGSDSPTVVGPDAVRAYVFSRATGLDPDLLSVVVAYDTENVTGNAVEVTVDYDIELFLNPVFSFANFTVTGESRMTIL